MTITLAQNLSPSKEEPMHVHREVKFTLALESKRYSSLLYLSDQDMSFVGFT